MPFEARALPTAIEVGGEFIAGPFCVHCGYPFTMHGPHMLCRRIPNPIMGPSCECHEVKPVPFKDGRWMTTRLEIVRVST